MLFTHPKMNEEGTPAGGGGASPAPSTPAEPTAPVALAAPSLAPVAAPAVEAKPEVKPDAPPDLAAVLAEFEAQKKKTAELEAELGKQKSETAQLAFTAAFDRAGVAPQYRDFLRSQLGDVDPRSEVGLRAIDELARKHPAMLTAHVSNEDPMSSFLRSKAEEARKAGQSSMWGFIPPDMMRGYMGDLDKGGR